MTRVRINIQTKLTYIITAFTILIVGLVGYIGYTTSQEAHIDKVLKTHQQIVDDAHLSLMQKLEMVKQDTHFIANSHSITNMLNWESVRMKYEIEEWRRANEETFKSLIELKKAYFKIRILDLNGKESVTVLFDVKSKGAIVQPENRLQNRESYDYYKSALSLGFQDIYISQMELNMEFGKILIPQTPILHFSTFIYDGDGNQRSMLVINAYAEYFFQFFRKIDITHENRSIYMVNQDGYYLYHNNENKRWGWQIGHESNVKIDDPPLFEAIQKQESGFVNLHNHIHAFKRVYPDQNHPDKYWVIISHAEKDVAFEELREFEYYFLSAVIFALFVLIVFIKRYIRQVLNPLSSVTAQIQKISNGEPVPINIEYGNRDEIGDLIEASNRLYINIKTVIEQAKRVADGDFSNRISVNGERNELSNTINQMTDRLNEVANLASSLSNGELNTRLDVRGSQDSLGNALQDLIIYFEEIRDVAERVAVGDFDISLKDVSEQDRLGIALNKMIETLKGIVLQAEQIAEGDYSQNIAIKSDKDSLGFALQKMTATLNSNSKKNIDDNWLKDGFSNLSNSLSGIEDIQKLSTEALTLISKHIEASSALLFLFNEAKGELHLKSSYAFIDRESLSNNFKLGEGVIGQVALEKQPILLKNISKSDFVVGSGIVHREPTNTYTFPIIYEGTLLGVIEVASFEIFSQLQKDFMNRAGKLISAFFFNVKQGSKIRELLEDSQKAYEELQVKSEELQQSNVQMEEQQQQLEQQAHDMRVKNDMLETAKVELDERAKELEKSSQYKSEFLANMSHELRTPLNSIILLSKMLSDNSEELSEESLKQARVINKSGQDLLLLINDILDLSKIESGRMDIIYDDFNTTELTGELNDLFQPIAKSKDLEFIVRDDYKNSISTDRVKLLQVLRNLLSNAFKFTDKGQVALRVTQQKDSEFPVLISVKDSGIGIPKDKLSYIFEAFKQVDGSISRKYGGTGLGLSISKKFVELIGGKIEVVSKENSGSTFKIYLPSSSVIKKRSTTQRKRVQEEKKPEVTIQEPPVESGPVKDELFSDKDLIDKSYKESSFTLDNQLAGKRVLIVDDDSRNIFSMSAMLQKEKVVTLHALNGVQAIEKLKSESVDLVLMDIMMPEMDGFETITKIRGELKLTELPIIAVTAKAMKEDKERCIEVGANDYMSKPIDSKALLLMIKAWVNKS